MIDNRDWSSSRRFITKQLNYRNPYFYRETKDDKRKRHRRYVYVMAFILVLTVLYIIFFSSVFKIREVTVEGGTTDRISFIEERVDEYLSHKIFNIIRYDNWFINSPSHLKEWLEHDISKKISLESLLVEKTFPRSIQVIFHERTAQLVLVSNGRSYLLDNQGFVISEQYLNPMVEPKDGDSTDTDQSKTHFPIIHHVNSSIVTIGQQIIPQALAQSIIETNRIFLEKYQELSIDHFETIIRECPVLEYPDKLINSNNNSNTNDSDVIEKNKNEQIIEREIVPCTEQPMVEYVLITPKGLKIYFTSMLTSEQQINAFHLAYDNKLGGMIDTIDYIDLRYPGRVYFK